MAPRTDHFESRQLPAILSFRVVGVLAGRCMQSFPWGWLADTGQHWELDGRAVWKGVKPATGDQESGSGASIRSSSASVVCQLRIVIDL